MYDENPFAAANSGSVGVDEVMARMVGMRAHIMNVDDDEKKSTRHSIHSDLLSHAHVLRLPSCLFMHINIV